MSQIVNDPELKHYPYCEDGETFNYDEKLNRYIARFPKTDIAVYAIKYTTWDEDETIAMFDTLEAAEAAMDSMKLRKKKYLKFKAKDCDEYYIERWPIRTMPRK